jgi:L-ascorbate metabolism protein UlaG (beta-lactamase superfamily)
VARRSPTRAEHRAYHNDDRTPLLFISGSDDHLMPPDAVELCGHVRPRVAIPIHYEGWKHFRQGREAIEAELATAPPDIAKRFRRLPIGEAVDLAA